MNTLFIYFITTTRTATTGKHFFVLFFSKIYVYGYLFAVGILGVFLTVQILQGDPFHILHNVYIKNHILYIQMPLEINFLVS